MIRPGRALVIFGGSLIACLLAGCQKSVEESLPDPFKDPDLSYVTTVLKTAMPLGYAANLSMSALQGTPPPNVTLVRAGDTVTGTAALMHITVDSNFPLPQGVQVQGYIVVAGFLTGPDEAILSVLFTDLNVTQGTFAIRDFSIFPVAYRNDAITGKRELVAVYADVDVKSDASSDTLASFSISDSEMVSEFAKFDTMMSFDSGVIVEENAWIIRVDQNQTLSDPSDDKYVVSGGAQYAEVGAENANALQFTMIDASMSPACKRNPVSGWMLSQNVGVAQGATVPELGHVFLTFHATCDGNAHVTAATGVYTPSWDKNLPLNLDR